MTFRARLRARAQAVSRTARIVLPEGDDPRVARAADIVRTQGLAEPIVLDSDTAVAAHPALAAVADHLRQRRPAVVRDGVHALDLARNRLRFAAGLVALGHADGCVAGAVATSADVSRAALWMIGMQPGHPGLSAAMYLGLDTRVLTFTDIAIVPVPTQEQLVASAADAAADRRALVGDEPVVAFLSYSTLGSASGAEVERVRRAAAAFRARYPDIRSDGELQFDAAIAPDVAARKAPSSPVQGDANVLVFPGLDAANITYKAAERLAGATAAGPLLQGLAHPMSDLSRGAQTDDIVDVIAMVALQAAELRHDRKE